MSENHNLYQNEGNIEEIGGEYIDDDNRPQNDQLSLNKYFIIRKEALSNIKKYAKLLGITINTGNVNDTYLCTGNKSLQGDYLKVIRKNEFNDEDISDNIEIITSASGKKWFIAIDMEKNKCLYSLDGKTVFDKSAMQLFFDNKAVELKCIKENKKVDNGCLERSSQKKDKPLDDTNSKEETVVDENLKKSFIEEWTENKKVDNGLERSSQKQEKTLDDTNSKEETVVEGNLKKSCIEEGTKNKKVDNGVKFVWPSQKKYKPLKVTHPKEEEVVDKDVNLTITLPKIDQDTKLTSGTVEQLKQLKKEDEFEEVLKYCGYSENTMLNNFRNSPKWKQCYQNLQWLKNATTRRR